MTGFLFTGPDGSGGHACLGSAKAGSVWARQAHYGDDRRLVAPDGPDATLAKEMNELSVQERERIFDDIHGVATTREESPCFIEACLKQLDDSLSELSYAKRKELDRAFFLRPSLTTDTKFKLMFLRADHYNAKQAAERMAKYFANKLLLFGEDKLVKKITLDDLNEQDMKSLFSKANMKLQHRDQAGRPIWYSDCSKADYEHVESTLRSFWYLAMATLEDETAQTKGVSCVLYCPDGAFLANLKSVSQVTRVLSKVGNIHQSLPCRITSFHFGTDEPSLSFFLKGLQKAMGKNTRLRMRSHFGSAIEIRYSLLTFGITCDGLLSDKVDDIDEPVKEGKDPTKKDPTGATSSGGTKTASLLLQEYRNRRLELESRLEKERMLEGTKTGIILYPAPNDVLLGRGRPYQDFSGNRRFAELIDGQIEQFQRCSSQFEKTCIIMDVVKTVKESYGGRFLKRTNNVGWEVIRDEVARKKTGTTFRTRTVLAQKTAEPSPLNRKESRTTSPVSFKVKRMKYDAGSSTIPAITSSSAACR